MSSSKIKVDPRTFKIINQAQAQSQAQSSISSSNSSPTAGLAGTRRQAPGGPAEWAKPCRSAAVAHAPTKRVRQNNNEF